MEVCKDGGGANRSNLPTPELFSEMYAHLLRFVWNLVAVRPTHLGSPPDLMGGPPGRRDPSHQVIRGEVVG